MSLILFAGGGSVGHIAPSVAVAEEIKKEVGRKYFRPTAIKNHFVCLDRRDETEFLRREGYAYSTIPAARLGISFLWKFPSAFLAARRLIRELRPSVVFCKGGYVSVPVALAARLRGIPIVVHESDALGGIANKFLRYVAQHVCLGFPTNNEFSFATLSGDKVAPNAGAPELTPPGPVSPRRALQGFGPVSSTGWEDFIDTTGPSPSPPVARHPSISFTGNPIRTFITSGKKEEGLRITGFSGQRPILLIMGGSQGAEAINTAVAKQIDSLLAVCDVIHVTGRGKRDAGPHAGYWSRPFVTEELPHLYACATLAVSRAGAGSIAELAACALPSILVPLPGCARDHQIVNARRVGKRGGCVLVTQDTLDTLKDVVSNLVADDRRRSSFREGIRPFAYQDASGRIAQIILGQLASLPVGD